MISLASYLFICLLDMWLVVVTVVLAAAAAVVIVANVQYVRQRPGCCAYKHPFISYTVSCDVWPFFPSTYRWGWGPERFMKLQRGFELRQLTCRSQALNLSFKWWKVRSGQLVRLEPEVTLHSVSWMQDSSPGTLMSEPTWYFQVNYKHGENSFL